MKTFKTEKHNIPEGATHYRDECDKRHFLWVKIDGDDVTVYIDSEGEFLSANWLKGGKYIGSVKPIPQTNIETPEEEEVFDSIDSNLIKPREMTQPRLSKCETVFSFSHGERRFILRGIDTDYPQLEVVRHETEAERVERERVNAIVEMASVATSPEFGWVINDRLKEICSKIHDAGYRKES